MKKTSSNRNSKINKWPIDMIWNSLITKSRFRDHPSRYKRCKIKSCLKKSHNFIKIGWEIYLLKGWSKTTTSALITEARWDSKINKMNLIAIVWDPEQLKSKNRGNGEIKEVVSMRVMVKDYNSKCIPIRTNSTANTFLNQAKLSWRRKSMEMKPIAVDYNMKIRVDNMSPNKYRMNMSICKEWNRDPGRQSIKTTEWLTPSRIESKIKDHSLIKNINLYNIPTFL